MSVLFSEEHVNMELSADKERTKNASKFYTEDVIKAKAKLFCDKLKQILSGRYKIEGNGDMAIVSEMRRKHYEKIDDAILQYVENALRENPEESEKQLQDILDFFSNYIDDFGFINPKYVYRVSKTQDTDFFWSGKDFYYYKTDRTFRSMEIEDNGIKFFFDVSTVNYKKADEKKVILYKLKDVCEGNKVILEVHYIEGNTKSDFKKLAEEIKARGIEVAPNRLARVCRSFERKCPNITYFICKDAKKFFEEQLKIWMFEKYGMI